MKKYLLKIDGMYGSMCETHVNDILRHKFNAKKVRSSYKDGEAYINIDRDIDKKELNQIFKDYGYKVYKIVEDPEEKKKGLFSFFKK